MPIHDFTEFIKLSSVLNYNLSAASLNRYTILNYVLGGRRMDGNEARDRELKSLLMDALTYLFNAYSNKRRRLGPMAVLHPLRAAVLFARAKKRLNVLDLLTILFHDVLEDVVATNYDMKQWREMETHLHDLLDRMPEADADGITRNLLYLTRLSHESYYNYIGRMLGLGTRMPVLVQIKLADRLDNTLDLRIDLQDPLEGVNLFQQVFQALFVKNYPGYPPPREQNITTALNSARRLHQLFKNAVLMSLVRRRLPTGTDPVTRTLFNALSEASLKEAQRTYIQLATHHCREAGRIRDLLLEAMDYSYSGRSDVVTKPGKQYSMDGLFSTYFDHVEKRVLNQRLDMLHQDKELMIRASVAFIVIFLSFRNASGYFVQGISEAGMKPQ